MNKKILALIFILIIVTNISYPQKKDNDLLNNIPDNKIDSLFTKLNRLETQLKDLEKKTEQKNTEYQNVNLAIDSANKTISWSGWIAIVVALLIVVISIATLINVNKTIKTSEDKIKSAEEKLSIAEEKFNQFIDSPDKISEALENLNKIYIEKYLFSNNLIDFREAIRKSILLSRDRLISLAEKLYPKIFKQSTNHEYVYTLYSYLKFCFEYEFPSKALEIYKDAHPKTKLFLKADLLRDIFSKEPFPIDYKEFILNEENKTDSILATLNFISDEKLNETFLELLRRGESLNFTEISKRLDKVKMTEFIEKNYDLISEEIFNQIKPNLVFNVNIIKWKYNKIKNNIFKEVELMRTINTVENLERFLKILDFNDQDTWIELIKYFNVQSGTGNVFERIKNKYIELKSSLPDEKFFTKHIPLLLQKDFGIVIRNMSSFYDEIEIHPISIEPVDEYVLKFKIKHPVLDNIYYIEYSSKPPELDHTYF